MFGKKWYNYNLGFSISFKRCVSKLYAFIYMKKYYDSNLKWHQLKNYIVKKY